MSENFVFTTFSPYVTITETYETSDDLSFISEILKVQKPEYAETDDRDLVLELKNTQWSKLFKQETNNDIYYPSDKSDNVYSNLLESDTGKLFVFDLKHFRN